MAAEAVSATSQAGVSGATPAGVPGGVPQAAPRSVPGSVPRSVTESRSAGRSASPAWLDEYEQRLWRRLLAAECRLREKLDHQLQETHGLTLGDYDVLVHLSEAEDGSLRMSELAERLLLSRSGLTRRVDGLVRAGWVERRACPDDGRGSLAVLTVAGLELIRAAAPTHVVGVRSYLIDPLAEIGGLGGLDRGLAAVEEALEGPSGPGD